MTSVILFFMQKWEYQVFTGHLDPAELVIILNESGLEWWELVALAPVTDCYPPHLIDPAVTGPVPEVETIPVQNVQVYFQKTTRI